MTNPYAKRAVWAQLPLGLASGLPLPLTASTLAVWLADAGLDLKTLGFFALVGLPYALKFLWAPILDQMALPFLGVRMGRRRAWGVFIQCCLALAIVFFSGLNAAHDTAIIAVLATLIAALAASQDMVLDALRVEMLEPEDMGAGAAMFVAGYRSGMLVAGAGALILADNYGWGSALSLMIIGLIPGFLVLVGLRGLIDPVRVKRSLRQWLVHAVVKPLTEFFQRPYFTRGVALGSAASFLMLIILFKLGDALLGLISNAYFIQLGFDKTTIAEIVKLFGFAATLIGGFAGGLAVARMSLAASLMLGAALQMVSNISFVALAHYGAVSEILAGVIAVENFCGGLGSAVFVAFLARLCNREFTATQYALFSALAVVPRTVIAAWAGVWASQLGFEMFFYASAAAALPAVVLIACMRQPINRINTKSV